MSKAVATKIRLKRMGGKKKPFYRVVVADARTPRGGRVIEEIGIYDPMQDPSIVQIDEERARDWLSKGAQPTERVRVLLGKTGVLS
jgi:small subunit ribosomal protein S16